MTQTVTMETKAVRLSVVILLISATSYANTTAQSLTAFFVPNNTEIFSNHSETFTTAMPTTEAPMELDHTDTALPSSTPLKVTSHISKTTLSIQTTQNTTGPTKTTTNMYWTCFLCHPILCSCNRMLCVKGVILVVIVILMVVVGCVHTKRRELSSAASRLQMDWRERLRMAVRNLENGLGVQLWSERKTGEEKDDDVEDVEGRHVEAGGLRMDEASEGSSDGKSNDDKCKHEKDDSETSEDDDSIKEWVDVDKQREAGKCQSKNMENKERAADGGEGAVEGESGRDTSNDPEEAAQVLNTDLFDVTVF